MCIELYSSYTSKIKNLGLEIYLNENFDVDKFIVLKREIKNELLPLFNTIVCTALQIKKLPNFNNDNIIQGITYGLNNYTKKIENKNYYEQNALSFIHVVEQILETTDPKEYFSSKDPKVFLTAACIEEQVSLLSSLFWDSRLLIQDIFSYKNVSYSHPKCSSSPHNPIFMMGKEIRNILYGYHLPFDKVALRIYPAIPTLRIMIEVKIRSAFGIIGMVNKTNNTINPISLSSIFSIIDQYVKTGDVIFNISYENLKKIYTWTNIYIHSGFKGYIWYPFIFNEYLNPLFYATDTSLPNGGWDMRAGIKIKKSKLRTIQNDIEKPFELLSFDDEQLLEAVLF